MTEYHMDKYQFETGVYRPPSEGGSASLLVRFTRNCPWNHCTFCSMYKTEKFELRRLAEIQGDIDAMAALVRDMTDLSRAAGSLGGISREGVIALLEKVPELNRMDGFPMLVNWLMSGGRTAFIQDANSPIMKTPDLVEALTHLRTTFPSLKRVTSYARSRTLAQKSAEALGAICSAGLDRLHLGLETGDDDLLKKIKKGVTAEGHVTAGIKAMAAGFQVSEYWMPGLGGKEMSTAHAKGTADVLSQINPHYIRSRPFRAIPGTPLHQAVQAGKVTPLSPREQLEELYAMVSDLTVTSRVCFDHAGNFWRHPNGGLLLTHDYEGYKFPEEKDKLLGLIREGLNFRQETPRFLHL